MLLGPVALEKLKRSHVLVAGLGGVGSWAAEMICRAGVGAMTIIDGDVITAANRNRQLPALTSTTGRKKRAALWIWGNRNQHGSHCAAAPVDDCRQSGNGLE